MVLRNIHVIFATKASNNQVVCRDYKLMHSGNKKYQCEISYKAFVNGSYFSKQKLIHSGIRNYQCGLCNKSFVCSSDLYNHKVIHRSFSMESVIKFLDLQVHCQIINSFTAVSRGFNVMFVVKGYFIQNNLSVHKLTHNSIKKHQCSVCNKTFTLARFWQDIVNRPTVIL